MQQVAQVTTKAAIALATARTIRNNQYNRISPGCSEINLVAVRNASKARQRRTYMMGTMKLASTDHATRKRIITKAHGAIVENKETACVWRKMTSAIIGTMNGNDSSAATINRTKPTRSMKRK